MRLKAFVALAVSAGMWFALPVRAQQSPDSGAAQQTPRTPNPAPLPEKNPEGQPAQPQPAPSASQPVNGQASSQPAPAARMFLGTIIKVSDEMMLKETATDTNYALDDQATAKHYEGQQVIISGSLDAGNMIHIQTIEPAK